MSLVFACQLPKCQYWCADRVLVRAEEGATRVVRRDHQKIHALDGRPVVVGLSGSAYDAEHILRLIERRLDGVEACAAFLGLVRTAVRDVNEYSRDFARQEQLATYFTGAVVGGCWDGRWFLRVITPDGNELAMQRFAAIGAEASRIGESLGKTLDEPAPKSEIAARIDACACAVLGANAGSLDRLLVDADGVRALPLADCFQAPASP